MALNTNFTPQFTQDKEFQKLLTYNKTSQKNLHDNFQLIKEYIDSLDKNQQQKIYSTIEDILELVVIVVKNQSEAFQLFDSQNTRGKKLDPHDLLKAFHLREISDIYSMRHNTEQWENTDNTKIRKLFNCYLYPIMNWINRNKTKIFTDKDIYYFKGVRSSTEYRYSKRIIRCMPCFQLGESFEAGENFFGMVNYYLRMREDIETEMMTNPTFSKIKNVLNGSDGSKGFELSKRLFFCALMTYYDRFGNFDIRAINKLCLWAFTIRLDMDSLRANTINAYAIGIGTNHKYSNNIPMFSIIKNAYSHLEIANIKINKNSNTEKRNNLRYKLEQLFV